MCIRSHPTTRRSRRARLQYAAGIKSADPTSWVAGPEDFGWAVYVGDPSKNGGLYNAIYYLQQMRNYEQTNGVRILDYFTEHWYPSPPGVIDFSQDPGTSDVQAARLRSTRTFWDPTYREENWIGTYYPPVQLIRTFHKWVNENYPNTKIGITEYNWGGQKSVNGALAQADLFGIFGREALDLATLVGPAGSRVARGERVPHLPQLRRRRQQVRRRVGALDEQRSGARRDVLFAPHERRLR